MVITHPLAGPRGPAIPLDRSVDQAPRGTQASVSPTSFTDGFTDGLDAPVARGVSVEPAMPPQTREDAALRRARRLLAQHPLIDGHNDLAWTIRHDPTTAGDVEAYDLRRRTPGDTDLGRLRAGGVGGQFWSVYIPGDAKAEGYARLQLEQLDIARRVIARYPAELALCLTARDVARALARRRIASLLGMEGGHAIENSLGALRAYYDLGARYLTLTHNVTHDWADAANDAPRHGGLTRFGEEVVREMNRLGMLVDLAHVSPAVMEHALSVSEAPVVFSHSSCRALTDVPRTRTGMVPSTAKCTWQSTA